MTIRKPKRWGSVKPSVGYGVDWSDPIANGLIGCWLFNEGAGGTLFDIARKNHGTFANAPTWTGGAFGQSLNFNAANQAVNVSAIPTMANPWTISGWVNWSTITNLASAFGFNNSTNGVYIGTTATNLKIASNGETPGNGTTALSTGKWYHLALFWDGTKLNGYINGKFEYNVTPSGSNWKSATKTQFGVSDVGHTTLSAKLDTIRTHSRALSATEIMRLYTEPFAGIQTPRRRLWSVVVSGSTVTGVGSSAGVGAALGIAGFIASSAGVGAASAVGKALAASVGSTAGVGAASAIGASLAKSIATSVGISIALGTAPGGALAVGSSTGRATVLGVAPAWTLHSPPASPWAKSNPAGGAWSLVNPANSIWAKQTPAGGSWAPVSPSIPPWTKIYP